MTEDELGPLMTAVELLAMVRGIPFDQWLREAIQAQARRDAMQIAAIGLPFISEADRTEVVAELARNGIFVPSTISTLKH